MMTHKVIADGQQIKQMTFTETIISTISKYLHDFLFYGGLYENWKVVEATELHILFFILYVSILCFLDIAERNMKLRMIFLQILNWASCVVDAREYVLKITERVSNK